MKRKHQAAQFIHYLEAIKDAEGFACIDVSLNEDTALYDPISFGENLDLNSSIYDFIDTQANIIPAHIPLRIRFHGSAMSPEEQENVRKIMRRHYTMKSYDITWDMAANFRKMLGFSLFGAAMLAVYFYVAFAADKAFASELLSIIGSFSLWEAAGAFLLDRPRLRREYAGIMQNVHQTVEFVSE